MQSTSVKSSFAISSAACLEETTSPATRISRISHLASGGLNGSRPEREIIVIVDVISIYDNYSIPKASRTETRAAQRGPRATMDRAAAWPRRGIASGAPTSDGPGEQAIRSASLGDPVRHRLDLPFGARAAGLEGAADQGGVQ